jgi:hypothetical protein
LVIALNNPIAREYYCKVAYKLAESQIWNNLEQSAKGKNQNSAVYMAVPKRYGINITLNISV